MPAFQYQAVDGSGKTQQGVIEADSARAARARLRADGLFVLELKSAQSPHAALPLGLTRRRLSLAQLALLLRQLATLLQAGLPLEQALSVLSEQSDQPYQRSLLVALRADVLAGHTLAQAVAQHARDFPELHRALIKAGEASGELAAVMDKLATYTENQQALRQKIGLAFVYPAIVTAVAVLVVAGLLLYVVPQVVSVFDQSHQTLPLLTRLLIGLSAGLAAAWPYLLALLMLGVFAARHVLQQQNARARLHHLLLRLPLLGRLIRGINTARMASTLSILFGSGVPLLAAMSTAAGVVSNLPMRHALDEAANRVREGVSLSRALAVSGLFPPVLIHLIASGEQSGRLELMLERVAKQQEQEVGGFISALTALLEPLLILLMGGVVLLIVLAVLLPIISMNQMIQ
ncbi:MAG: type II secretion system inner membrane protein GspF [Sideroxydans sp.]